MNPTKFFFSPETATLYFMEGNVLCGMPQYKNGSFDMEESFLVDAHNTELGEEHIHSPESENFTQLKDVWQQAKEVLA